MVHIAMAYIVMAYTVMVHIGMAYVVMAAQEAHLQQLQRVAITIAIAKK